MTDRHRGVLARQRALVTGATSDIGRAIALALAAAGAAVAVNHRDDAEAAEQLARDIASAGSEAFVVRAEMGEEDQVEAMFAATIERFGAIDILVNNADIRKDVPFHEMSLDDWRAVLNVNLTGQFLCARAAVRAFLRRGTMPAVSKAAGKIIFISSVHAVVPWAGCANYSASKGGVEMMMRSLAEEFSAARIRLNAIAPAAIRTDINRRAWETPDADAQVLALISYRRAGEIENIAKAAVWLASDGSDYVTGTTLFIDGGVALYPGSHGEE